MQYEETGVTATDPVSWVSYYWIAVVVLLMGLGLVGLIAFALGNDIGVSEGLDCCRRVCGGDCACHAGECQCCGNTTSCHGCVGTGGGGCVVLLGVLLFLAGLVVAIGVGIALINRTVTRHMNVLWLRGEAQRFVVEDLAG